MKKCLYLPSCIVFLLFYCQVSYSQVISTVAGNGTAGYAGDGGPATTARLDSPTCIALDLAGNLYINDQFNSCVRKVDASGNISTVAGTGVSGYSGDGGPAVSAKLQGNWGMTVDVFGNIYICDQGNHRVRKVSSTGMITTIAGTGVMGYSGDGGPATDAKIFAPLGIAVDPAGNVYFSDSYNFCVRKISPSGIISTVVGIPGSGGFSGDGGPATAAKVRYVWGLATDVAGNLYLCDAPSHRVRKVDASGIITTIAGSGSAGYDLDNVAATAAKLFNPTTVFVAGDGKIYIGDYGNNRIRRIDNAGIITTIAGTGVAGYNGDGLAATSAYLHHPIGVCADEDDNIYLTDLLNVRVRKVSTVLAFVGGDDEAISVCENSAANAINTQLAIRDVEVGLTDVWSLLAAPHHGVASVSFSATSTGGLITPAGLYYTPDPGYVGTDTFKVKVENAHYTDVIAIYVKVDPLLSVSPIMGASSVCVGDTARLTNATPGGLWTSNGGFTHLFPSSSYCTIQGSSPGVDTINYQVYNACGSVGAIKLVTVNPLPDAGAVSGPDAFCVGSVATFFSNVGGGTWATSNLNASVEAAMGDSCIVRAVTTGASTVIHFASNAWCTAAAIKQVKVDTFPYAGVIYGPEKVCLEEQVLLTDSVEGGVWSGDTGVAPVISGVVTGKALGSALVSYNVTNSCGTDVTSAVISVYPLPDAPNILIERGILYTATTYASYQWLLNGAPMAGATDDSLFADSMGTYQLVVSNEYGCHAVSSPYEHAGCMPSEIMVYPNPAKEKLFIAWCRKLAARLNTVDGKEVMAVDDATELNISALPAAVYLLVLYDKGHKVRTEKVVKLR